MSVKINSKSQLQALARELGLRKDWHEPDERGVSAVVRGTDFDNAGFWGREPSGARVLRTYGGGRQEIWIELFQDGEAVAEINLASLLGWASEPES